MLSAPLSRTLNNAMAAALRHAKKLVSKVTILRLVVINVGSTARMLQTSLNRINAKAAVLKHAKMPVSKATTPKLVAKFVKLSAQMRLNKR